MLASNSCTVSGFQFPRILSLKKKKSLHQDYIDGEKPSTQLLHTVVIDNQKVTETLHLTECCDGTEM